jgi:hypothetical protein
MEKKIKVKSSYFPQDRPSFNEWCVKFDVGRFVVPKPQLKDYYYNPIVMTKTYKYSLREMISSIFH